MEDKMTTLNLNQELAILEVSGVDATTYLQGQLTNDIKELTQKKYQLSAHLNNKGRIIAAFIITQPCEDTYYLITTRSVSNKILPRLKMFILRSKVTLTENTLNIALSENVIADAINLELSAQQYLVISSQMLAEQIDKNLWHKFLVEHNIPLIYEPTQEKIIPQQINFELLGGVNFKKGCYTGQEIVARTHYLGKVKRRLAKFTSDTTLEIGQTVVSPQVDNQEVGIIIDYYCNEQKYIGLVSLQMDCINNIYLDIDNNHKINCNLITQE